jgi:uncharacterized iron-regulated protein
MFQDIHGLFTHIKSGKGWAAAVVLGLALCSVASAGALEHASLPDALAYVAQHPPVAINQDRKLPFPKLMDALDQNRVVFVGEIHDRYDHHLNQLAILQALHQKTPKLAIGVEWFQQPFQPVVNDFLAGRIDESELLRRTEYFDRWRYDYRMLRPIMEYAKANGLPVIALNAPVELTRKVSEGGLEALTAAERAQLPSRISPPDKAYRSRLEKIFARHGEDKSQLENFMLVQRIWDETMAQNITRFLQPNPDWRMVVFSGSGHISYGAGIPQDVAARLPGIRQVTLASSDPGDVQPGVVDYFILTHPASLPATGKLGVWLKTAAEGVQIGEMTQDSAAQKAGLQTGDRLASLNGTGIRSLADLMLMLGQHKPGEKVSMTVQREGKAKLLPFNVTLQ